VSLDDLRFPPADFRAEAEVLSLGHDLNEPAVRSFANASKFHSSEISNGPSASLAVHSPCQPRLPRPTATPDQMVLNKNSVGSELSIEGFGAPRLSSSSSAGFEQTRDSDINSDG